jgi:septum formation protein
MILASASPRRRELLAAAGFTFAVEPMDVDETTRPGEEPAVYVERVARAKAEAAAARHPDRTIVAADTVVVVDGLILGKPRDTADAARMLVVLSGRSHDVLTALVVVARGRVDARVERTVVWFTTLSEEEVRWYVASGEPMDKAGGYAIQGRASRFIPRIEGSYSNVVGLPVATLETMIRELRA